MPRELVIFARRHGSKTKVLLSGPEVPLHVQKARFKQLMHAREHPDFELVELAWLDVDRSRRFPKEGARASLNHEDTKSARREVIMSLTPEERAQIPPEFLGSDAETISEPVQTLGRAEEPSPEPRPVEAEPRPVEAEPRPVEAEPRPVETEPRPEVKKKKRS